MNREKLTKLADEAIQLFLKKEWAAAIAKWDKIIPLLDDNAKAKAYSNRGNAKDAMGDHEGAIADYDRALEIDPQLAKAYANRGNTKNNLSDYQGAIADLDRALEIDPQLAEAYNNRGSAKSNLSDYQGAIADFDQALKIDPRFAEAYNNRGNAKSNLGNHEGAIADFDQALKIDPQLAEAHNNRGATKDTLGDHKGAIADLAQAIAINPQYADGYYNRGVAKSNLGDHEGAIADYDIALKMNPAHKKAVHNRAVALAMQESQKGRKEIEAQYQAQLQAQQEKFDRELQNKIAATEDISKELEYEDKRGKYDEKLGRQKKLIEDAMTELRNWSKWVYGAIAAFGAVNMLCSPDASPFLLLPFIITGTLLMFPLGWRIRMLNRDKYKYWALREDADAKIKMARIILINPTLQKELIVKLFDHHNKLGSANLIADLNRADTGCGNSVSARDIAKDIIDRIKPGGKDGDS